MLQGVFVGRLPTKHACDPHRLKERGKNWMPGSDKHNQLDMLYKSSPTSFQLRMSNQMAGIQFSRQGWWDNAGRGGETGDNWHAFHQRYRGYSICISSWKHSQRTTEGEMERNECVVCELHRDIQGGVIIVMGLTTCARFDGFNNKDVILRYFYLFPFHLS